MASEPDIKADDRRRRNKAGSESLVFFAVIGANNIVYQAFIEREKQGLVEAHQKSGCWVILSV